MEEEGAKGQPASTLLEEIHCPLIEYEEHNDAALKDLRARQGGAFR